MPSSAALFCPLLVTGVSVASLRLTNLSSDAARSIYTTLHAAYSMTASHKAAQDSSDPLAASRCQNPQSSFRMWVNQRRKAVSARFGRNRWCRKSVGSRAIVTIESEISRKCLIDVCGSQCRIILGICIAQRGQRVLAQKVGLVQR